MKVEEMVNLIHDLKSTQAGQQKKVAELLEELEFKKSEIYRLETENKILTGNLQGVKSAYAILVQVVKINGGT